MTIRSMLPNDNWRKNYDAAFDKKEDKTMTDKTPSPAKFLDALTDKPVPQLPADADWLLDDNIWPSDKLRKFMELSADPMYNDAVLIMLADDMQDLENRHKRLVYMMHTITRSLSNLGHEQVDEILRSARSVPSNAGFTQ